MHFFFEQNNSKANNIGKREGSKQKAMFRHLSPEMPISRPRNFSRTGFIIPLKITRRPLSTVRRSALYACIHANCRIYYGAGRVCIWESEFRGRIHPVDYSAIHAGFLDISSPFFSFLSPPPPTFEFHAIVVTAIHEMIDIGLLIFRNNVA